MAKKKRRGGGSELTRSEVVTVRLDPKLRYLASLAARKQRRTLSSFVEWSIEESLVRFALGDDDSSESIAREAEDLWDVDEPDRFVKLALNYPELLTYDEQRLWKLICESGCLWKGSKDKTGKWRWKINITGLQKRTLRQNWDQLNAIARGDAEPNTLPPWPDMPKELLPEDIEF